MYKYRIEGKPHLIKLLFNILKMIDLPRLIFGYCYRLKYILNPYFDIANGK